MDYKIRLDSFEGPLDLLLSLIEKAKIDIYDIPISEITKQYIEYIYEMEDLNLEIASEFILMASTLLQIKSKMLLPEEPKEEEDEENIDPRDELVLRLLEYKKYKEAAEILRCNEHIELKAYYKPQEDLSVFEVEQLELGPLDLDLIVKCINNIIKLRCQVEEQIDIHKIHKDEYSIKDCSDNIINILDEYGQIKFTDLLNKECTRSKIVAYFLSILELMKLKLILVEQDDSFTNLIITKAEIGE